MSDLFITILCLDVQAVLLIAILFFVRFMTRRMSKKYIYILWVMLTIRLLCPVVAGSTTGIMPRIGNEIAQMQLAEAVKTDPGIGSDSWNHSIGWNGKDGLTHSAGISWAVVIKWLTAVWLAGAAFFLLRYVGQYLSVKRRVAFAVRLKDNIWQCDGLETSFVMGFFRPKIYIPYLLSEEQKKYILQHEETHVRHHDAQLLFLVSVAAAIHWYNPFVWLAAHYIKLDVEMYCDELTLRAKESWERKAYSEVLLQMASCRERSAACLNFGAGLIRSRICHIFKMREAKGLERVLIFAAAGVCAVQMALVSRPVMTAPDTKVSYGGTLPAAGAAPSSKVWEEADAKAFADQILAYIKQDDALGLSGMVHYPVRVNIEGRYMTIGSPEEFVQNYPMLLDETEKQRILQTDTTQLFRNQYGWMLADGSIWYSAQEEEGLRIYAVN